jgi:hypothetical protein
MLTIEKRANRGERKELIYNDFQGPPQESFVNAKMTPYIDF